MLILGIDDAGRGPLIGPMMLAGVLVNEEQEKILKKEGVADSKVLTHPVRERLAEIIEANSIEYKVVMASPNEIDEKILLGTNLNTIEAQKTAEIINTLNDKKDEIKVIVDCPSINTKAWRRTLLSFIEHPSNLRVYCEHKADVNHPSVSAASILAKVAREKEVAKIKEQYEKYGNTGSGYPSDPATKAFLRKFGRELENSGIFRKTWATYKEIFPQQEQKPKDKKQLTLGDF